MSLSPRTEEIATNVVDAAFSVHSTLGPGLLESVYEECMAYEFEDRNLAYERQLILPIDYKAHRIDTGLRLDFLVTQELSEKII